MKNLQDKLSSHRINPSPLVWEKIDAELKIKKLQRKNLQFKQVLAVAATVVLILASWFTIQSYSSVPYEIRSLDIPKHQEMVTDLHPSANMDLMEEKYHNKKGKLLPNYQILADKPLMVNKNRSSQTRNTTNY